MLIDKFKLFSFYRQMEVYGSDQQDYAAGHWTDRHVWQGFISLPESAGFGLLHDLGDHFAEVYLDTALQPQSKAVRAIVVPYTVPSDGRVEFSDCVNTAEIQLPAGDYALLFEIGFVDDTVPDDLNAAAFWVRFTFAPQQGAQPAILVADEDLQPTYPLLLGV